MKNLLKVISAGLVTSTIASYPAFTSGGTPAILTWAVIVLLDLFELLVAYKTFLSKGGSVKSSSVFFALLLIVLGLGFPYLAMAVSSDALGLAGWVVLLSPLSNWGILLLAGKQTSK